MTTDSITKAIETLELKSFSILYVEDEEIVRCTIIRILSLRYPHARINTAENGAEGLELFKEFEHDMVITDHNMPIMTGAQMAVEIRLLRPETIIIFIAGRLDHDVIQYLTRQGVVHFLEKPPAVPDVAMTLLNKGVYDFLFRTNYPDFAVSNPFQPVADFTTGITTMFVLEEG